jgi:hypothetical protein
MLPTPVNNTREQSLKFGRLGVVRSAGNLNPGPRYSMVPNTAAGKPAALRTLSIR